ncbi:MAG TPA: DUF433 domain-containing protein [Phycisphaerae bacterium]|nr:DUF433 domain-containing protein [Phycisphaerae bacterium]
MPDAHIEITPGYAGGRPRIAGHRIRVQDVVVLHEQCGHCPDEIIAMYPGITLADVYAALAYYHDHMELIRSHLREDEELATSLKAQTPSLLTQVLEERQRESTSISPG